MKIQVSTFLQKTRTRFVQLVWLGCNLIEGYVYVGMYVYIYMYVCDMYIYIYINLLDVLENNRPRMPACRHM